MHQPNVGLSRTGSIERHRLDAEADFLLRVGGQQAVGDDELALLRGQLVGGGEVVDAGAEHGGEGFGAVFLERGFAGEDAAELFGAVANRRSRCFEAHPTLADQRPNPV